MMSHQAPRRNLNGVRLLCFCQICCCASLLLACYLQPPTSAIFIEYALVAIKKYCDRSDMGHKRACRGVLRYAIISYSAHGFSYNSGGGGAVFG